MHCNKMNPEKTRLCLISVLLCFLLSGCAGQRWSGPLPEEEQGGIPQLIAAIQKVEKECPDSLDADALIFWKSPLDDWGVEGYMQLLSPSFIKFIVSNPLGQPVYAFASNGDGYQILLPRQYRHIRGNIRSLAIRKELPQILVLGDWFSYLTGKLPTASFEVVEINRDAKDTSIWLHIVSAGSGREPGSVWVHLDREQKTVLGYLFLDSNQETVAEIVYGNQQDRNDSCSSENEIKITELPWGAELTIQLKDISHSSQFSKKDFSLPVPPSYNTQLHP